MNMRHCAVAAVLSAVGSSSVLAQAPTSAQVWEVIYVVDRFADAAGLFPVNDSSGSAARVDITIKARVGIRPNTSATGTTNFGVIRVCGGSGFRLTTTDALSQSAGLNQGRLDRALTNDYRTVDASGAYDPSGTLTLVRDPDGNPITGLFAPFRGGLDGANTDPLHIGRNSDTSDNGLYTNPATGRPFVTAIVGGRNTFFGAEGTLAAGVAQLDGGGQIIGGDFVNFYRLSFFPRADQNRTVTFDVTGATGRYISGVIGTNATNGPNCPLPNRSFTVQVPTPGAIGTLGAGLLMASRRRRR